MDLTPQQIATVDPLYWAVLNRIRLPNGNFTDEGREYLVEPMQSEFRRKCFMKGTQGGASLIVMLMMLHGMIYRRYPNGVLYLFPNTTDMQDYSQSRFGPLIESNPTALGQYVRTSAKSTDTARLKKVGPTAHLYLRGAGLTQKLDAGYSEAGRLKSITVDAVVFDEVDLMDEEAIVKACGRYAASKVQDEVYIGNPGVPNSGIDAFFQESDQRHWFMVCQKCGADTCAEKEFFDNPSFIKIRDNGTSYLGCKRCGTQITNKMGHWIPDVPANSNKMRGWRWSQLIIPYADPARILHDYRYPPQDNIADVLRTKLGMPYQSAEDQLTENQVFACCGDYPQRDSHPGPCAMGVDQGDIKHVVIGIRTARTGSEETFAILKVARLRSWDDIYDLARRFNVRSAVIDLRPNADSARAFQKRAHFKTWLCNYSESTPLGSMYNEKTGIAKVNRTEILDASGKLFSQQRVEIPRKCPAIKEFAEQVTNPICVEERDKRTGAMIRRYKGKNDHYRHVMNYFLMAARGGRIAIASDHNRRKRQTHAKSNYAKV